MEKDLAIAYDERATEEEKVTAKRLDRNGDGKVCLLEFKESVSSWLSSEKVFKQHDANGEGTREFNDDLAIYYKKTTNRSLVCSGCNGVLLGQFFSCFTCLPKYPESVDLCCDCYDKGEFKHEHSISHFVHSHSLLKWFMSPQGNEERTQEKREMEELHKIARAHYHAGPQQVQDLAHEFFNSMDSDGDGRIDLPEFLAFVRREGRFDMHNRYFFKELDRDGNGSLDFWEAMTLHYIIKSRRPFCYSCANIVPGIFYSCVECSFTLCYDCYRSTKHNHNGRTQFLDNYKAKQDSSQATQINPYTREMEELREIARAHYHAGAQQVQDLAHEFFNSMDSDGDGRIDFFEFLAFVKQEGHYQMHNLSFFKELDRDGNGSLDFWEVMTLYYIIKSRRPFCDFCTKFVPGIFFSCVECSFTLCCDCYRSTKCDHNHNGRTQFLDNYMILQAKQDLSQAKQINPCTQTYGSHCFWQQTYCSCYVHNPNPSPVLQQKLFQQIK
ncbi:uncharacterized protein LOC111371662 isoform X1 [Olea europaea var. sylvestris]|uniref:uncharacterized protein LOC111371662 isoform X1 n=1 Tax=Olea europaea var. sylvestris TaxID=158386 RepID=UPI000C1D46BC|nr:uncharacterized protein LOC111371662 isoform X1 [Olea europaea var. sylvestris]